MELPDGYSARAPRVSDLEAIAHVLAADGQTTIDAGFLAQQWSHSEFDLSRDAVVVLDGDQRIVAYAQVNAWEPAIVESWGTVHPAHRGRGLGSALLDELEARAARLTRRRCPGGSATRSTRTTERPRPCSGPGDSAPSGISGTWRSIRPASSRRRDPTGS